MSFFGIFFITLLLGGVTNVNAAPPESAAVPAAVRSAGASVPPVASPATEEGSPTGDRLAQQWLAPFQALASAPPTRRFQAARDLVTTQAEALAQAIQDSSRSPEEVNARAHAVGILWETLLRDADSSVRATALASLHYHLQWNDRGVGTFASVIADPAARARFPALVEAVNRARSYVADTLTSPPNHGGPYDAYAVAAVEYSTDLAVDILQAFQGTNVARWVGGPLWGAAPQNDPHGQYPKYPHPTHLQAPQENAPQIAAGLLRFEPWLSSETPTADSGKIAQFDDILKRLDHDLREPSTADQTAAIAGVRALLAMGTQIGTVKLGRPYFVSTRENDISPFLEMLGRASPASLHRFSDLVSRAHDLSLDPGNRRHSSPFFEDSPVGIEAIRAGGNSPVFLNALRTSLHQDHRANFDQADFLAALFLSQKAGAGNFEANDALIDALASPQAATRSLAVSLILGLPVPKPFRAFQPLLVAKAPGEFRAETLFWLMRAWKAEAVAGTPGVDSTIRPRVADLGHTLESLSPSALLEAKTTAAREEGLDRLFRSRPDDGAFSWLVSALGESHGETFRTLERRTIESLVLGNQLSLTQLLRLLNLRGDAMGNLRHAVATRLLIYHRHDNGVSTRLSRAYIDGSLPENWRELRPERFADYHLSRLRSLDRWEREEAWRVIPALLDLANPGGPNGPDESDRLALVTRLLPTLMDERDAGLKKATFKKLAQIWNTDGVFRSEWMFPLMEAVDGESFTASDLQRVDFMRRVAGDDPEAHALIKIADQLHAQRSATGNPCQLSPFAH